MPQAVPAVVAFFSSTAWYVVIARTIIMNVALGALAKSLTRRPKSQAPPINVTIKNTIENRRMIFGRAVRAGGVFVYYGASSVAGASTNDILWYVIVYAGHQVAAIKDVWLDTEKIPDADINPSTGAVSTSKFAGKLSIWKYLGTSAQTHNVDLDSAISDWTPQHRLAGCAYIVVKMTRSDEAYTSGAPQNVTALVDGALMYDPRLDSTNGGSGTHRANDPSTWAASQNPALIVRWYLTGGSVHNDLTSRLIMYGLKESDSRIDDAYVRAAANICDESIAGANIPPTGGAQVRYACNLEVSTGEERREILTAMLVSMAGTLTYVHGKWRVYAGAYDTPLHSFTQDDLYGDLEIEDTTSHPERYNQVSAVYIDDTAQYQEATTPLRRDPAYETQDGGEPIPREIELRGVTNQYQAQRLAEIELRRSRMMRSVKMRGSLNLLKVAVNETFTLSHERYSWSNRVFRCIAREFEYGEEAGRVVLTARREDSGVYADMLTADYTTGESATDVFTNDAPDAPVSLTAEGFQDYVVFSWVMPAYRGPGLTVELWEHTAATPFSSATKVAETTGNYVTHKRTTMGPRYYWIRFRNQQGQVSATYPASSGAPASPSSLSDWVLSSGMEARDGAFRKISGASAWDESIYSRNGYLVCHVKFKPSQTDKEVIIGLNADPTTGNSEASIDIGWRCDAAGICHIYEGGGLFSSHGSYTTSTEFAITNDGTVGRYYKDRVLIRTVGYAGVTTYMDSSFYSPGAAVNSLRFAPGASLEAVSTPDIDPNAVTAPNVTVEPADGNMVYAATVQPAFESPGLNGVASYTAPAFTSAQVNVSWSGQARISNTTSGTAVGDARIQVRVFINAVEVWSQYQVLEGYTGSADWANFSGSRAFSVPAGQMIDVYLQTGRNFSTGGASPAQTMSWREALINLVGDLR